MNNINYFLQFLFISLLFLIFKLLGWKYSGIFSGNIFKIIGPLFRSNQLCYSNLSKAFPEFNELDKKKIVKKMWFNYGQIFSEYMYLKDFRINKKFSEKIIIKNQNILHSIKENSKPVVFISGHFNNFELMAMHIEKSGVNLAAIYRPLNNIFLNPIMERIRKKYICKKQIKKGISGTKEILNFFKNGTSIALMIDQRVTEGLRTNFFGFPASTTTIPAQFIKKFGASVVPIHIERNEKSNFVMTINEPLNFSENETTENITSGLNEFIEKMIKKNPEQWIWTHNRWK